MLSMSKMQTAKQSKDYLTKENYYQKNSEKGYLYSTNSELLNMLEIENAQEIDHQIHTNLIFGFSAKSQTSFSKNSGAEDRRAGIDLTTSAPKSFSLLTEYYNHNNQDKYNELIQAQTIANQYMMSFVSKYIQTRIYDSLGNRIKIPADMVYATFNHDTTREIDGEINPQQHTHNYIYNIVACKNSTTGLTEFKSLNLDELFSKDIKLYLGQIYRNHLAEQLLNKGYDIELTNAKEGFFEIKGFDRKIIEEFSGSSLFIQSKLEEYRLKYPTASDSKLKDVINDELKKGKKEVNREELLNINNDRMKEMGIDEQFVSSLEKKAATKFKPEYKLLAEQLKKAYIAITTNESTFKLETLIKEALKQSVHLGATREDIIPLIVLDNEIVQLDKNIYSTQEVIEAEKQIIEDIHSQAFSIADTIQKDKRYTLENGISLSSGQQTAVSTIVTSHSRFIAVQGDAGSGKTYALKVINEAHQDEYELIGLAPTARAAGNLEADSGISSQTVAKYLLSPSEKGSKPRVFFVDESSMLSSLDMKKLFDIALVNDDKIVFVGDTKQFASIGAGKMFNEIQKYGIETVNVTENMRQESDRDKEIVQLIKTKATKEAIAKLEKDIIENTDNELLKTQIISDFKKSDQIICSKNTDRDDLNIGIRTKLKKSFERQFTSLKAINLNGVHKYHSTSYSIGDVISTIEKVPGFASGKSLKIIGIKDDNTLIIQTGQNTTKELNISKNADKVQLFREKLIALDVGEKIIFTKNHAHKGSGVKVENGVIGIVKSIKGDDITVETDGLRTITFKIDEVPYLDYAYAITDYKSQGMSIKSVKILADVQMANLNSFYTQVTRLKKDIKLYTTDKEALADKIANEQIKSTTLDYTQNQNMEKENVRATDGRNAKDSVTNTKDDDRAKQADRSNLSSTDSSSNTRGQFQRVADYSALETNLREIRERIATNFKIKGKKMELDYKQIKQQLNTQSLLNDLLLKYEIKGHKAFFDKSKGEYRIQVASRNYNAIDYLLKVQKLNFQEVNKQLDISLKVQTQAQTQEPIKIIDKVEKPKVSQAQLQSGWLNKLKTNINLAEFIASYDYSLDKSKTSKNWIALENSDGDKIRVFKKDDVYCYFNPLVEKDKGTIVEFLKNRGVAQDKLYTTIKNRDLAKIEKIPTLTNVGNTYDNELLYKQFKSFKLYKDSDNNYLQERGIDEAITTQFSSIRVDDKNNVVTPMYADNEFVKFAFSGYNQKLSSPLTIAKDGTALNKPIKDLNRGNKSITVLKADDLKIAKTIVISESFIDGLSFLQLNKLEPNETLVISTNGQNTAKAILLIKDIQTRNNSIVIIAMDNDKAGKQFADIAVKEFENATISTPRQKDFNEDLQESRKIKTKETHLELW